MGIRTSIFPVIDRYFVRQPRDSFERVEKQHRGSLFVREQRTREKEDGGKRANEGEGRKSARKTEIERESKSERARGREEGARENSRGALEYLREKWLRAGPEEPTRNLIRVRTYR